MSSIHIRVPASSGNLGSGFDTLGLALSLHNRFTLDIDVSETQVEIEKGLDPALYPLCLKMVQSVANFFFSRTDTENHPFMIRISNEIPLARGLASSATIRLAILAGLNHLLQANVEPKEIVKWAAELEGSTDNVASCFYGGMTVSGIIQDQLICYRFEIPSEIHFIAVSPTNPVETDKARKVFPKQMLRSDAIFTLNRASLLAAAFAQNDYANMRYLFEDRIHQPFRQQMIPALKPMFDVIEAANRAGALGAFLSGSGSTMMALAKDDPENIAGAMQAAFAQFDMESDVRFLEADNEGLLIQSS